MVCMIHWEKCSLMKQFDVLRFGGVVCVRQSVKSVVIQNMAERGRSPRGWACLIPHLTT